MEKSLGQYRVNNKGRRIWDANSSLYDSFELNSFRRQLDSAIISSARSQSMPHLSDRHPLPKQAKSATTTVSLPKQAESATTTVLKKSKIFGSLNKFLRSFLRHKASLVKVHKVEVMTCDKFDAAVCGDQFGELSTIHELPESGFNGFLSEFDDSNFKIANKTSADTIIFEKSKFEEDLIIVKKLPSDRLLTSSSPFGISLI